MDRRCIGRVVELTGSVRACFSVTEVSLIGDSDLRISPCAVHCSSLRGRLLENASRGRPSCRYNPPRLILP